MVENMTEMKKDYTGEGQVEKKRMSELKIQHYSNLNDSVKSLTQSLMQYFLSLNLAILAGFAYVRFTTGTFQKEWVSSLSIFLAVVLFVVNSSIFNIYLRNNIFANKNWDELNRLLGNPLIKDVRDVYKRTTHKTISFIISLFTSFSLGLLLWAAWSLNVWLVSIITIVAFFILLINSVYHEENPIIIGMKIW